MKKSKLPKTLTTVTAFSKTLAVFLLLIFLLGAFREGMKYQKTLDLIQPTVTIAPSSVPTITPANILTTGSTTIVSSQDNGKVLHVKVGDRVAIQLSDTMNWSTVQLSNTNVLQPSPDGVFYIHAVQGRYKAVAPGTVDIRAIGGPICKTGEMCPQFAVLFKTTIVVSQ